MWSSSHTKRYFNGPEKLQRKSQIVAFNGLNVPITSAEKESVLNDSVGMSMLRSGGPARAVFNHSESWREPVEGDVENKYNSNTRNAHRQSNRPCIGIGRTLLPELTGGEEIQGTVERRRS